MPTTATTTSKPKGPPGRRPDPTVNDRAIAAVLEIYNTNGLRALNFDTVARTAGVGKAALYARWESIEALLVEALQTAVGPPGAGVHSSVADDLVDYANKLWDHYTGTYGMVSVRLNLDAGAMKELDDPYQAYINAYRQSATGIIERGIERGELRDDESTQVILDMVVGAVMLNALFSNSTSGKRSGIRRRIETIVHTALEGRYSE